MVAVFIGRFDSSTSSLSLVIREYPVERILLCSCVNSTFGTSPGDNFRRTLCVSALSASLV